MTLYEILSIGQAVFMMIGTLVLYSILAGAKSGRLTGMTERHKEELERLRLEIDRRLETRDRHDDERFRRIEQDHDELRRDGMTRTEIMVLHAASENDRARLWAEAALLRREVLRARRTTNDPPSDHG